MMYEDKLLNANKSSSTLNEIDLESNIENNVSELSNNCICDSFCFHCSVCTGIIIAIVIVYTIIVFT